VAQKGEEKLKQISVGIVLLVLALMSFTFGPAWADKFRPGEEFKEDQVQVVGNGAPVTRVTIKEIRPGEAALVFENINAVFVKEEPPAGMKPFLIGPDISGKGEVKIVEVAKNPSERFNFLCASGVAGGWEDRSCGQVTTVAGKTETTIMVSSEKDYWGRALGLTFRLVERPRAKKEIWAAHPEESRLVACPKVEGGKDMILLLYFDPNGHPGFASDAQAKQYEIGYSQIRRCKK
jgi:hypothetical protein